METTVDKQVSSPPGTMLVVDDNPPLRERLSRALRDRGYRVDAAADYDEAMQLVRNYTFDKAVIDLRMPGKSGMELLRDIKKHSESTDVLVLTGFGSIATAVDALKLGAVNFLPKPADADDVLAAFARANQTKAAAAAGAVETPSLARAEWEHIHRVLADCGGNLSEAARRLGIHRRSLQRKLQKRAPE